MSQMNVGEWRRKVEGVLGTCNISAKILRKIALHSACINNLICLEHRILKGEDQKEMLKSYVETP